MIHTPIIPNRQIIHILPLMPNLQIVVLDNELHEPLQRTLGLLGRELVDLLHVVADGEDGLPACDRVGVDHGVDGFEDFADVFGGAARLAVDFETVFFGGFVEGGLGVGGCEGFEELLVGLREAVVELVAGCPQSVCLIQ